MASATDKFRKLARKWVGQVGAGGVANNSATTVPFAATTGLPTDTATDIVLNRVNANGVKTPSSEETITTVISGSDGTNSLRGQEGTAQAHGAGSVAESLFTAKTWNDHVDGILVNHNQDGTHITSLPLTTPKITTSINDANGNEVIKTPATTSAVNEITVTNAATGNAVQIGATGGDDNISLNLVPKGTGRVQIGGVNTPLVREVHIPIPTFGALKLVNTVAEEMAASIKTIDFSKLDTTHVTAAYFRFNANLGGTGTLGAKLVNKTNGTDMSAEIQSSSGSAVELTSSDIKANLPSTSKQVAIWAYSSDGVNGYYIWGAELVLQY